MIALEHKQLVIDGEPRLAGSGRAVVLAAGTAVLDDPSYDVGDGPGDTVRVTGGPGPLSVRFG